VDGAAGIARVGGAAGIAAEAYTRTAAAVGQLLASAGAGLIVVPDRGVAVEAYLAHGARG
jgi:hypothetical protein